jgi:hypothetical protein
MFPVVIDRPVLTGVSTAFGGYGSVPTATSLVLGSVAMAKHRTSSNCSCVWAAVVASMLHDLFCRCKGMLLLSRKAHGCAIFGLIMLMLTVCFINCLDGLMFILFAPRIFLTSISMLNGVAGWFLVAAGVGFSVPLCMNLS